MRRGGRERRRGSTKRRMRKPKGRERPISRDGTSTSRCSGVLVSAKFALFL